MSILIERNIVQKNVFMMHAELRQYVLVKYAKKSLIKSYVTYVLGGASIALWIVEILDCLQSLMEKITPNGMVELLWTRKDITE